MNKKILACFAIAMLMWMSYAEVKGDEIDIRLPYLSVGPGLFISSLDNFSENYSNRTCFSIGGNIGFPTIAGFGPAARVVFIFKNSDHVGTATFRQRIIGVGLLYQIQLPNKFKADINVGLCNTKVEQNITYTDGSSLKRTGKGTLGIYFALGADKILGELPLAAFVDVCYNSEWKYLDKFTGNNGGMNIAMGLRLYIHLHGSE